MRRSAWIGAVAGLLAGLLIAAPAPWLARALSSASAGQVQLLAARGSVWDGSGQLVLRDGAGGSAVAALPTPLSWSLRPTRQGLSLALASDCCIDGRLLARLSVGADGWRLALPDAASRWPASLLAGLGAPWNTIGLQGIWRLRTEGLSVEWSASRWQLGGRAVIEGADLVSKLSTLRPLGSYRLRVEAAPAAAAQLRVETLAGPLRITADGRWIGPRLQLRGEASAEAGAEDALGNLLNILGRRDGSRSVIALN